MSKMSVKQAVELLRKMVAIPSTSFHEEEVGAFVLSFLRDSGIEAGMVGKNIVARSCGYDPAKPTLMLCAHMDTVEPAADYSFDPFKPQQPEDRILGLGSNDDGGSVVSMISVFSEYREKDLPINLLLALTVEEERSGPEGMRSLWGKLRDEVDFAIVGEPTGMRAATSERGLLVIDGVAEGVAGHAARGEGVNALYIALDDISALRSHVFPKVSPVMGKVGLNVTQISAGTAHNVIPDRCSFVVDIRPTEQYDNSEILEELQALCKSRLTARNLLNRSSAGFPSRRDRRCPGDRDVLLSYDVRLDEDKLRCDKDGSRGLVPLAPQGRICHGRRDRGGRAGLWKIYRKLRIWQKHCGIREKPRPRSWRNLRYATTGLWT